MKPAADLALIEDLDRNILTLCTHINAATYELLVLIREFDERAGWLKWGLKNRAEWLAWRCERRSGPRPRQMMTFLAACRLPLRFAAQGPLLQVRALT